MIVGLSIAFAMTSLLIIVEALVDNKRERRRIRIQDEQWEFELKQRLLKMEREQKLNQEIREYQRGNR